MTRFIVVRNGGEMVPLVEEEVDACVCDEAEGMEKKINSYLKTKTTLPGNETGDMRKFYFSDKVEWLVIEALPLTKSNMTKLYCWIGNERTYPHIYFHER